MCWLRLQVLLPPSAGAELMRQDAPKNGAQLFELASASGRTMHAGWAASARMLLLNLSQLPQALYCRPVQSSAQVILHSQPQIVHLCIRHSMCKSC